MSWGVGVSGDPPGTVMILPIVFTMLELEMTSSRFSASRVNAHSTSLTVSS